MDKYTIKRNREPLTPEDVRKGKDFGSFMNAYAVRKKPFYTKNWFLSSLSVAALAAGIITMNIKNAEQPVFPLQSAFISPPLNGIDIADTVFTVKPGQGGNFFSDNGSFITVPANAFLDSAGKTVDGNVELHYRELPDPASAFLAGIPMTYDSAGARYHFRWNGMMEIYAFCNGKPLKADPQHPVLVSLPAEKEQMQYGTYYLDTIQKAWTYKGRNDWNFAALVSDTSGAAGLPVKQDAGNDQLLPPRKANRSRHSFAIKFDPQEFPELAIYKGVRFEVDETKTPYRGSDAKVKWEDAVVTKNRNADTYTITFTRGVLEKSYVAYPVVGETDYAAAKKLYEEKYSEYLQGTRNGAVPHFALSPGARAVFTSDSCFAQALALHNAHSGTNEHAMYMRAFTVSDFGIWMAGVPQNLPQGATTSLSLKDGRTKKELVTNRVYLVEKGTNALFTYDAAGLADFTYDPAQENSIWAVTADGKPAVFYPGDFKTLGTSEKKTGITMRVPAQKISNAAQAMTVLGS
ncbi:MAG TPA: hypothetical protein VFU15_10310 [Bacteroidia bacterium]|nr:hypothetical protein [Bacteroidia bacterium]